MASSLSPFNIPGHGHWNLPLITREANTRLYSLQLINIIWAVALSPFLNDRTIYISLNRSL